MKIYSGAILIVEDDPFLGPGVVRFLEKQGYHVRLEKQGAGVVEGLDELVRNYDIFVLDLMLPDISGEEILVQIKGTCPEKPVLILTAKGELKNKKDCFRKGADDYLVKPFEVMELQLRIEALLRRTARTSYVRIGSACLNLHRGSITDNDQEHVLSSRSLALLRCLLENRGKIVSKQQIMSSVWNDTNVTDESIRTYIKELRKILPKNSIKTYKGRGYLLS